MSGRLGVLLVPVILIVAVVLSRRSRPARRALSRVEVMMANHRVAVGWRWAGIGLGVVAAALTAKGLWLGLGMMLAPVAFGLLVIAGVIVGELATIPQRQGVRTAALKTRNVRHYLPRLLGGLVAASTLSLGALLVATTLMGSADDLGRAGRSLSRICSPATVAGGGPTSASHGPWPGLFYSVPLAVAVLVGLVSAALALRTVVLRPRSGSDPELIAADEVLRRRSAEAVVAATGVMVAASLVGVALTAASGLLGTCPTASWTMGGIALLVLATLMLLLAIYCLALLLAGPGRRGVTSHEDAPSGQGAYL
jgi:hypothetical protein